MHSEKVLRKFKAQFITPSDAEVRNRSARMYEEEALIQFCSCLGHIVDAGMYLHNYLLCIVEICCLLPAGTGGVCGTKKTKPPLTICES